jgi:Fe2+ or Zn2+ uptake regulation protein
MTKQIKGNELRLQVMRTLIEAGGPVTFAGIKRSERERQIIYYHLEALVKDGLVVSTQKQGCKKTYECQPIFYDPHIKALIQATKDACMSISVNRHCATETIAAKSLKLLFQL